MLLNPQIIKHHLKNYDILYSSFSTDPQKRFLSMAVLYDKEHDFLTDRLYVTLAKDLTDSPVLSRKTSIVCIGMPPDVYLNECNIICINTLKPLSSLFNSIQTCFLQLSTWEYDLQKLFSNRLPLREYGKISLPIFRNPITFMDCNHRCMFMSFDDMQRPLPESAYMSENSYMDMEELNLMLMDSEYNDLMNHTEPVVLSTNLYEYKSLVYNVFLKDRFIGRLMIYNIYKEFEEYDFILLPILGKFIANALNEYDLVRDIQPHELENILKKFINKEAVDLKTTEQLLSKYNWHLNDDYICISISTSLTQVNRFMQTDPIFRIGSDIYSNSCIISHNGCTVIICNLSTAKISPDEMTDIMNSYCKMREINAGISIAFDDLSLLSSFYIQASTAAEYAELNRLNTCDSFSSYALKHILELLNANLHCKALCPQGLLELIKYDRKKGKNFTEVLKIYMENNMSIAKTINILYMHRTTFLYQIERIKEILNMDLNDPDNRLWLQLALKLLEANDLL